MNASIADYAQRAYWVLKTVQFRGSTITYGELADLICYPEPVWQRRFGDMMAIVRLEDEAVADCAVNKKTGKPTPPGPEFYEWKAGLEALSADLAAEVQAGAL